MHCLSALLFKSQLKPSEHYHFPKPESYHKILIETPSASGKRLSEQNLSHSYPPLPPLLKKGKTGHLMIHLKLHVCISWLVKKQCCLFYRWKKISESNSNSLQLLPVWVLMCPWSSQGLEKALPQILQTQGSVWVLMCILSAPRLTYSLSQYLQLNDFLDWASQCSCLCLANPEKVE